MNKFGDFLYKLRKEKGITQSMLADELGVTNKAVSKWETGESMPETSLLLPISRIFDVTVDELLDGKRKSEQIKDNKFADDEEENFNKEKHLFTRGKDEKISRLDIISGTVCGVIIMTATIIYLIIGGVYNKWSGYWILLPAAALTCGIIGIISDLCNSEKRRQKIERGENPYTSAVCGILMLTCIIVYLFLGATLSLWHPYWIIVAAGGVCCGIIGMLGNLFIHKK